MLLTSWAVIELDIVISSNSTTAYKFNSFSVNFNTPNGPQILVAFLKIGSQEVLEYKFNIQVVANVGNNSDRMQISLIHERWTGTEEATGDFIWQVSSFPQSFEVDYTMGNIPLTGSSSTVTHDFVSSEEAYVPDAMFFNLIGITFVTVTSQVIVDTTVANTRFFPIEPPQ